MKLTLHKQPGVAGVASPFRRAGLSLRDRRPRYQVPRGFTEVRASDGRQRVEDASIRPERNCYCERLIGTTRRECLDFLIPLPRKHLRRQYCQVGESRPNIGGLEDAPSSISWGQIGLGALNLTVPLSPLSTVSTPRKLRQLKTCALTVFVGATPSADLVAGSTPGFAFLRTTG